jgi:AcrR family transcriptional regulator
MTGGPGTDPADVRTRILEATLACVDRRGLAKTSLEDVATEAGVSRATVYRYFAGGREQLISDTVSWEVLRFLLRLAEAMEPEPDLEAKLVRGIVFGHQAILDHLLLQRVLLSEPELLLTEFHTSLPGFADVVRDYLAGLLATATLREGVDSTDAADYLSHLFLSYLGSHGRWDLADEASVRELVRTQFLAGIIA